MAYCLLRNANYQILADSLWVAHCQMFCHIHESILLVQVGADVANSQGDIVLRATSRQLLSSGYLAVYASIFFRGSHAEEDEEGNVASRDSDLLKLKVNLWKKH